MMLQLKFIYSTCRDGIKNLTLHAQEKGLYKLHYIVFNHSYKRGEFLIEKLIPSYKSGEFLIEHLIPSYKIGEFLIEHLIFGKLFTSKFCINAVFHHSVPEVLVGSCVRFRKTCFYGSKLDKGLEKAHNLHTRK